MQNEATTSELAEILSVSRKTICAWAKSGLMEKSSHGKYKLKESLRNFAQYCAIVRDGGNLHTWIFESVEGRFANDRELPFGEEGLEEQHPVNLKNVELVEPPPLEEFEVELDDEGRVTRVIRSVK